jgi:hypothetical protein
LFLKKNGSVLTKYINTSELNVCFMLVWRSSTNGRSEDLSYITAQMVFTGVWDESRWRTIPEMLWERGWSIITPFFYREEIKVYMHSISIRDLCACGGGGGGGGWKEHPPLVICIFQIPLPSICFNSPIAVVVARFRCFLVLPIERMNNIVQLFINDELGFNH